ncbi:MHO_4530 family protein [Mycoplasmopsis cynos]|uniref:MHO_4530 family protein n=1 Tax=Mycoplasmopsis cynos TaxID=171284 RepID=UPI0022082B5D|nr:hypothetical protein [Mycoplasmopsis cynos]UWV82785.1 hypothetical protein NW067_00405 [Mycoplasmopsis cynos]
MNYFDIIIIILVLFFIIGSALGITLILYIYYRSSSGIIIFKVDKINNRVLRITNSYSFVSTIFDSKKSNFKEFNYLSLNDFLEYFDEKSIEKFNRVFETFIPENNFETIEVNINKKYHKNFTLVEKFILLIDKTITNMRSFKVVISQNSTRDYICSLKWAKSSKKPKNFKLINFAREENFKLESQNNLVIGMLLKPEFYFKEITEIDIYEIFLLFNLNYKKTYYFNDEGMIYFIIKNPWKSKLNEVNAIVKKVVKNRFLNKLFNIATCFTYYEIKTNNDLNRIKNILKYSLYHIYNKPNEIDEYINLNETIFKNEYFLEFNHNLNKYHVINNSSEGEFDIKKSMIVKYKTQEKGNLFLLECDLKKGVLSDSWASFFKKIPYLEYKYQTIWYNYISEIQHENSLNSMVKISQEVFLDPHFTPLTNKSICLVYAENNSFLTEELREKIMHNSENNVYTVLYIQDIDRTLINIINTVDKLRVLIIGQKISQRLNDWTVFYECFNIIKLLKSKRIRVVFENPLNNLDDLIVEKLNLNYAFYSLEKEQKNIP